MDIFMGMDYKIILPARVPSDLVKLISEIDEFKGRWEALKNLTPDRLSMLRKVATVASVGSSTRIEGARLSDAEVEELLSNVGSHSFMSRDEEEVAGYADAMNLVFDSFKDISITENHIKQLHHVLLKHSTKDERHKGEYKKLSNNVEAFNTAGKSVGIVFETASPFKTPFYMKNLATWYGTEKKDRLNHPLLDIGAFIVHFLAIHPFQDGNGRLSRVLTTLMLLQEGYLYVPYCSLESIVEENKDRYYLSLRKAQTSFKTGRHELDEWLRFFLSALKKQKDILQDRIHQEKTLSTTDLPVLSRMLLQIVRSREQSTVSDLVTLSKANRNTIKKHLKSLVEKQLIRQQGIKKGAWYSRW
jgi:Fic family protein